MLGVGQHYYKVNLKFLVSWLVNMSGLITVLLKKALRNFKKINMVIKMKHRATLKTSKCN
jgi:hypothetical protein